MFIDYIADAIASQMAILPTLRMCLFLSHHLCFFHPYICIIYELTEEVASIYYSRSTSQLHPFTVVLLESFSSILS